MKQFFTVFRFEFKNYAKNKVFIAITLLAILLLAGVLFFPRLKEAFGADAQAEQPGQECELVALADASGTDAQASLAFFSSALPQYDWELADADVDTLKAKVEAGSYRFALLLQSPLNYQYIVSNLSMTDTVSLTLDELIVSKYRADTMQQLGLTAQQSQQLLSAKAEGETITTGKDQMKSYFYTFILMFALYMTILMYGQFVASSVVTEKSSKAMELLITSAKPSSLMFGKVVGTGLAGLVQLVLIVGSAFLFFNLNRSYWDSGSVITSLFDMPLELVLYTLLFFVTGYFLYAFLFGALASLASRMEDVNTLVMPVMLVFVASFMATLFSMVSGNVDSTLMKALSFVPFTSPMAMFARIAMSEVAVVQIILSIVILIASIIGVGFLAAGIYRVGVLMYGKPPKLKELARILRGAKG